MTATKKKTDHKDEAPKHAGSLAKGRVFDMHPPGKSIPSTGSKPVIITNRSQVRSDPMVTPTAQASASEASEETKEEPVLGPPKKLRIEPLHPIGADEKESESSGDEPSDDKSPDINLDLPDTKEEKPEVKEDESPAEDLKAAEPAKPEESEAAEDEVAEADEEVSEEDQDKADEKEDQEAQAEKSNAKEIEDEAAAKRRAAAEALIESKKYFVPINAVKARRSKRALVVVLLVTIAVLGVIIALDAGLISTGATVPIDFISD